MNWLKTGDVIRVSKIYHQFFVLFPRIPGTTSIGGIKRTFVNTGTQDYTAVDSSLLNNCFTEGISLDLILTDTSSPTWFIIFSTKCDCDHSNVPSEFFFMLTPI